MPSYEDLDWYDAPLYYDIIFDTDTRREADFLEALHKKYASTRGKRALEPACGSGRLILELCQRGWKCTGMDLNPHMLEFAKQRLQRANQKARLQVANMSDFSVPAGERADLAFNLVSTFKYLLTEKEASAHLQCMSAALKPGGIYVLGFHLSPDQSDILEKERWQATRDGVLVDCTIESCHRI